MKNLRIYFLVAVFIMQFFVCEFKVFAQDNDNQLVRNLASDNNVFAVNLFNQLNTGQDNIFFSPYSISTSLSMIYCGAKGETEKQIAEVLNFQLRQNDLYKAFSSLEKELLLSKKDGNDLNVANAIWMEKTFAFLPEYLNIINTYYGSVFFNVDFKKHFKKVRLKVNQWVESKTNNKIKDLMPEGVLTKKTRMVLTNAIYFNGKWETPFDESKTKDDKFWINRNEFKNVSMMNLDDRFDYWSDDQVEMLEIPYSGFELSMIIILPKESTSNIDLQYDLFQIWDKEHKRRNVNLFLPKFKFESSFDLKNVLSKMGMPDVFNEQKAKLSGISVKEDLFLSAVLHKAFVDVNEKGTEATAATMFMAGVSGCADFGKPIIVKVDHPFMFAIKHNDSGNILFLGKVYDPIK